MRIVIGVGTPFRRDDGAGPAVIDLLRADPPAGVALAVTDGEPARLIALWDGADRAVVVDAVSADPAVPGRIHALDLTTARRPASVDALAPTAPDAAPRPPASGHALGLEDAVALGAAVGCMPCELHVLAIEGGDFGWGPGLSPPVACAVREVAARVRALVEGAAG
ncbi:hydrogenase maturation protease [Actinomadura gamaensis]|uniref:Hydrogenase maturation protease n=1 Tax=Actinomadura gamaensis TaxID=1763541 RepID=A0ABV9TSN0_9ACTN